MPPLISALTLAVFLSLLAEQIDNHVHHSACMNQKVCVFVCLFCFALPRDSTLQGFELQILAVEDSATAFSQPLHTTEQHRPTIGHGHHRADRG